MYKLSRGEELVRLIQRVYIPATQPRVSVAEVCLRMEGGEAVEMIRDDVYVVDFKKIADID